LSEDLAQEPVSSGAMTVPAGYRPRKCADVLELDMGDGVILYNHDGDLVHHLNPSAGIIWQLCDGDATVGDLAGDIADEYRLDHDTVATQVATVIAEFNALALVEDARSIDVPNVSS